MKHLFLFLSLLFLALPAHALTTSQIINTGVASRSIYSNEVDALVLDIIVKPLQDDTVKTLVVENIGQPPVGIRVGGLSLWLDAQEQGYQGWEQDIVVGTTSTRDGERWLFTDLALPIKSAGTRLFVTATVGTIRDRLYPMQWTIPQFTDVNRNNAFDSGDAGVFFSSADHGPMDGAVVNPDILFLNPSASVQPAPQSAIIAPSSGATMTIGATVKIAGKARSRGGAQVQTVQVRIGEPNTIATAPWKTVESTGARFSAWEYSWTPTTAGTIRIETRASDENALGEEPHGITVSVVAPATATPKIPSPATPFVNALVKISSDSAVYYVGANGKRYAFPNVKIYYSWYPDFRSVSTVTPEQLSAIPLGGVVTYRPGTRLVKLQTDPHVYAVSKMGVLRWVSTEIAAIKIWGSGWATLVDDLPDAFFSDYTVGDPLTEQTFFSDQQQQEGSTSIGLDKGL